MGEDNPARVVVVKDDDKSVALQRVLEGSGFLEALERLWAESGKGKEDFLIAVKPNIMMAYSREDPTTIDALKHFPCHFGLIDAYWSADGLMGLRADHSPRHTKTIIGGESIIAVEWVGAKKMGLDPHDSRIFHLATTAFGMPEVEWVGDQSTYEDWSNVPDLIDKMMDVGEEYYTYANWLGFISSEMDPAFPPKIKYRSVLFVRRVMKRLLRLLSRYGL